MHNCSRIKELATKNRNHTVRSRKQRASTSTSHVTNSLLEYRTRVVASWSDSVYNHDSLCPLNRDGGVWKSIEKQRARIHAIGEHFSRQVFVGSTSIPLAFERESPGYTQRTQWQKRRDRVVHAQTSICLGTMAQSERKQPVPFRAAF